MQSNISIRQTSTSYQIYPIEEKEQEQSDFQPYSKRKNFSQPIRQINGMRLKTEGCGQSVPYCEREGGIRVIRGRSLQKQRYLGNHAQSLQLKTTTICLKPSSVPLKIRQEHWNGKKQKTQKIKQKRLHEAIKRPFPSFFKEQKSPEILVPQRVLNLGSITTNNIFLAQLYPKAKLDSNSLPSSKKQLKKLISITRMLPPLFKQTSLPSILKGSSPVPEHLQ